MTRPENERPALVTGSSRGLGRATAIELAARGHPLVVHYVRSEGPAAETVQEIEAAGGRAVAVGADVADAEGCDRLLRAATEAFGPVAVLVNNAGVTADGLAMRMKDDAWQRVLDTNLTGAFRLSRGVLRAMLKARWGRIVNLSSVVARMGNAGQANYVASKAGLIGLTKALAREVSGRGVTVNAVAPGFIESDMTDALPDELKASYLTQIPAGRFGTPHDVAAMVAFLAGDEAAYVTGQTLSVDGGLTMQ